MSISPDELAARYGDPYRKSDRIEISTERFEKGMRRGDDGGWGVGALVFDGEEILFVREGDMWLLPGGRLEPGEPPETGAKREVREETGVEIEIAGLGAISEQTFVREGTDDSYEFTFATFLGEPVDAHAKTNGGEISVVEAAWRRTVPENTFDRELVTRLVETRI